MRLIPICSACERGDGGECHVPGCSFYLRDAPTEPLVFHEIEVLPSERVVASLIDARLVEVPRETRMGLARSILDLFRLEEG